MPWKETCAMDQKINLISDYLKDEFSITELSQLYRVSRETVYKWVNRYEQRGLDGLEELVRAPLTHPNATSAEITGKLLETRIKHPNWGPRKIVARLERLHPESIWPAPSTAGSILKKEGLVKSRLRRRYATPYSEPFQECNRANDVWSIDYKGQFRMGDGRLCYPLTITDNYSRYLLGCQGLYHPSYKDTRPLLERAFRQYGLPIAIRSDNGSPFASTGLAGISPLSIWLIKLWVRPERIHTGHPEQNGRHERMHRTLKAETVKPPRSNLKEQQRAFDIFRKEFNTERPHEALGMEVPADYYQPSCRILPKKLPEIEYPACYVLRQVRHSGEIKWKGECIYLCHALAGETVGLRQIGEREWEVRFSFHPLGILDEQIVKVRPIIAK